MKRLIRKSIKFLISTFIKIIDKNEYFNDSKNEEYFKNEVKSIIIDNIDNPWHDFNKRFVKEIIDDNKINSFLRTKIIRQTMFATYEPYVFKEYFALKRKTNWKNKYKNFIVENKVGFPEPFVLDRNTSGNLIHQAYNISVLEKYVNIINTNIIFEFGGGYGAICNLVHKYGFNKKYIIFDFPLFSSLQRYYLKSNGLKIFDNKKDFLKNNAGILLVSNMSMLKEVIDLYKEELNKLFLATWSFSETQLGLRESFFPLIENFDSIFIAYQNTFDDIDNNKYFESFKLRLSDKRWHDEKALAPNSCYLIGK